MNNKYFLLTVVSFVFLLNLTTTYASETIGTVNSTSKYAWGEILGWINFSPTNGGVSIDDSHITGYAWSSVAGWINFSPSNGGVTNNCQGELGGSAWSGNYGWIPMTGITINAQGVFTGAAGSSTLPVGRINFDCANCRVVTDWRQCSLRASTSTPIDTTNQNTSQNSGSFSSSGGQIMYNYNKDAPKLTDNSVNNIVKNGLVKNQTNIETTVTDSKSNNNVTASSPDTGKLTFSNIIKHNSAVLISASLLMVIIFSILRFMI